MATALGPFLRSAVSRPTLVLTVEHVYLLYQAAKSVSDANVQIALRESIATCVTLVTEDRIVTNQYNTNHSRGYGNGRRVAGNYIVPVA